MSAQLSAALEEYRALFGDYPTVIGWTDETMVRRINQAIAKREPLPEPEDEEGELGAGQIFT